jgi:3-phenylpropionate/trans-cinnamate dioxygenase ferredoxin subunit
MCHGSIFDLATGEAIGPPAEEPVPVFDVRIEGDEVQVAPRGD